MAGINATLATARRAMMAQQAAMSVTGDNIANANTPGYARRRGEMQQGPVIYGAGGGFGTGVDYTGIRSLRDPFIEQQLRRSSADAGRYDASEQQLSIVETTLGGLDELGLNTALDRFWSSWHDLASDPTSKGARSIVQLAGQDLANRFQGIDRSLNDQTRSISGLITEKIDRANLLINQLAKFNQESLHKVGSGEVDDARAGIMDELSKIVGATFQPLPDGSIRVLVGAVSLVEGSEVKEIGYEIGHNGVPQLLPTSQGGQPLVLESGEIAGLMDVQSDHITDLRTQLDRIAVTLATEVNAVHTTGYDFYGNPAAAFFNEGTTGIGNFKLSKEVTTDPSRIAASLNGRLGDNSLALAMGDLETAPLLNGTQTIGDGYKFLVTEIGAKINENRLLSDTAQLSKKQMESWRESVSGVSIDEEMSKMIQYENAFNAAAKLTQTLSKMLDTVMTLV